MNWRNGFLLGIASAILSSFACCLYNIIYSNAFFVNFHKVINVTSIISISVLSCLLMAVGYVVVQQWKGDRLIPWLNILYCSISYVSITGVLSFNLPLEIEFPEMFPGLAIPMHFFPVLSVLTLYPFFIKKHNKKEIFEEELRV